MKENPTLKKTALRKKMDLNKALALVCFLLGLSLFSYPALEQFLYKKQQVHLLTQWEELEQESRLDQTSQPSQILVPILSQGEGEVVPAPTATEPKEFTAIDGLSVYGILTIDKVNLREPILEQADQDSLQAGIGIVEAERSAGQINNFVLAGHRSRTFGKQFNRLDELQAGDVIHIQTTANKYVYSVTETFIVQEDDLSVLDQESSVAELTLITCEYDRRNNPTLRLIVKAHLASSKPMEDKKL